MNNSTVLVTEQEARVLTSLPADKPIVMLNLLRFRDHAAYGDPAESCSGREAYKRYSQTSLKTIAAVGGSVVFGGKVHESLIGPVSETWHQIFLVRYPSVAAFRFMLAMPEYQACVYHRTAALEDSRLTPISAYSA